MSDYADWEKWTKATFTEIQQIAAKMMQPNTQKENISLRKDYIHKCDEWLRVCAIMSDRISHAKGRAEKQLEALTK